MSTLSNNAAGSGRNRTRLPDLSLNLTFMVFSHALIAGQSWKPGQASTRVYWRSLTLAPAYENPLVALSALNCAESVPTKCKKMRKSVGRSVQIQCSDLLHNTLWHATYRML